MRTGRWIVLITIIGAVILAIAYGFLPRSVPVEIAKVSHGPMRVTVEEEGKTRVKDRFVVSAPVAGFMRRVNLQVGDFVKKGQVLTELEPLMPHMLDPRSQAEVENQVSAAEAALAAAEKNADAAVADAEYARYNLERAKRLYEDGYVSDQRLKQAENEAKRTESIRMSADANVNVARAELERLHAVLRYSAVSDTAGRDKVIAINAPVAGRILKVHRESEGVVHSGEPLVDIGDPKKLEVKVEVLSTDAVKIKPGTPVSFERWGGGYPLSGKVRIVEPAGFTKISSLGVEEQRVLVIADVTSSPGEWRDLGDGYRVDAHFFIWEGTDVLQIPASAIFRRGDKWGVFIVENGIARIRQLEIGHRNGLIAEIISGVTEGEEVIAYPDDMIKDGIRVKQR